MFILAYNTGVRAVKQSAAAKAAPLEALLESGGKQDQRLKRNNKDGGEERSTKRRKNQPSGNGPGKAADQVCMHDAVLQELDDGTGRVAMAKESYKKLTKSCREYRAGEEEARAELVQVEAERNNADRAVQKLVQEKSELLQAFQKLVKDHKALQDKLRSDRGKENRHYKALQKEDIVKRVHVAIRD